ncbi:MAG: DUF1549 domain-containing protein [Planctomycetota bacterium]|nr:DUF1549 domain-containing protein [Planctomycetota bacterium]
MTNLFDRVKAMQRLGTYLLGLVFLLTSNLSAAQPDAVVAAASALQISPAVIQLNGQNRRQQLVVTATSPTGLQFDVTHLCELAVGQPSVATIQGSLVVGVTSGNSDLEIRYGGQQHTTQIVVTNLETYPAIDFRNDIMPLFSKRGCNSGGCHGKQAGQNGFKLSVFGFDARADYGALLKEARGRRIFPAAPGRSLLLRKAIGTVPHGGGARMPAGSLDTELLTQWIHQGMPWGSENAPRVTHIEIDPAERVLQPGTEQQLRVTAIFNNGHRRDVTSEAAYTSNAELVAQTSQTGRVATGTRPGEAAITINYMGHVGAARMLIPRSQGDDENVRTPAHNRIDELVLDKLNKLRITPSELCDDATFFRRIHLHTLGSLPDPSALRSFLTDTSSDKRRLAVDRVLKRNEYTDYWTLKWADIMMVNAETLGERGAYALHTWLRRQFATNRPYDEWVRELLTASGNSGKYGPVNFFRGEQTKEDLTKTISQAFLGIRMDCAQCHHHPFEKWGQEDFYGMAGFFNGLEKKTLSDSNPYDSAGDRELVYHRGFQETQHPTTGVPVPMRAPGGPLITAAMVDDQDPRVLLADWATADDNPYFARLVVNRIWKSFMGRALVEPEDDLRSTNPATNEPLLDYLAEQIVASGFDLKAVMRMIMQSRTYQLSSQTNATNRDDNQNFSHFVVKRLPAEVLLDAISEATGTPDSFDGMPKGTRAIQLWDNRMPSYFLETFGRSERKSPCECAKSSEPTMAQALHLMNAPEIDAKISHPAGRLAALHAQALSDDKLVEELCLAVLGRFPGEKEKSVADTLFRDYPRPQAAEDFLWTLLNSYDFLFIR